MKSQVISLGYEGRNIGEFIDVLLVHKVNKILDVRELPLSRKKGFSKRILSDRLAEVGILYKHIRIAGNPYHKQKADVQICLDLYAAYLSNNPHVIEATVVEMDTSPVAFLCYERLHKNCHRSILLDKICEKYNRFELAKIE